MMRLATAWALAMLACGAANPQDQRPAAAALQDKLEQFDRVVGPDARTVMYQVLDCPSAVLSSDQRRLSKGFAAARDAMRALERTTALEQATYNQASQGVFAITASAFSRLADGSPDDAVAAVASLARASKATAAASGPCHISGALFTRCTLNALRITQELMECGALNPEQAARLHAAIQPLARPDSLGILAQCFTRHEHLLQSAEPTAQLAEELGATELEIVTQRSDAAIADCAQQLLKEGRAAVARSTSAAEAVAAMRDFAGKAASRQGCGAWGAHLASQLRQAASMCERVSAVCSPVLENLEVLSRHDQHAEARERLTNGLYRYRNAARLISAADPARPESMEAALRAAELAASTQRFSALAARCDACCAHIVWPDGLERVVVGRWLQDRAAERRAAGDNARALQLASLTKAVIRHCKEEHGIGSDMAAFVLDPDARTFALATETLAGIQRCCGFTFTDDQDEGRELDRTESSQWLAGLTDAPRVLAALTAEYAYAHNSGRPVSWSTPEAAVLVAPFHLDQITPRAQALAELVVADRPAKDVRDALKAVPLDAWWSGISKGTDHTR